eukprot:tig00021012_g17027.t1
MKWADPSAFLVGSAVLGGVVVFIALVDKPIRNSFFFTNIMVATVAGIVVSPLVSRLIDLGGDFGSNFWPKSLRNLIQAESGINDGLAYPFVWLPLAVLLHEDKGYAAGTLWFAHVILYERPADNKRSALN